MATKSLFTVSTASSDIYPTNRRWRYTNKLPIPVTNCLNKSLSLSALHLEKSFNPFVNNRVISFIVKYVSINKRIPLQQFSNAGGHSIYTRLIDTDEYISAVYLNPHLYESAKHFSASFNVFLKKHKIFDIFHTSTQSSSNKLTLSIKNTVVSFYANTKSMSILGFQETTPHTIKYAKLREIDSLDFNHGGMSSSQYFYKLRSSMKYRAGHPIYTELELPSVIKVYCSQLSESVDGHSYHRLLAVCPGPSDNSGGVYTHAPTQPLPIKIDVSELTDCQLEIRDQDNDPINFTLGTASYIKLDYSSNDNAMEIINIYSNDSQNKEHFASNSPTSFTSVLPAALTLGNHTRWTMKLISFSMSSRVHNITREFNTITVRYDGKPQVTLTLPIGFYETEFILIDHINKMLVDAGLDKLLFEMSRGYIRIKNNRDAEVKIGISNMLSIIFGQRDTMPTLSGIVIVIPPLKKYSMSFKPRMSAGMSKYVKILCPQLKPIIFGGAMEPVLCFTSIADGRKSGWNNFYQFTQSLECEIGQSMLESISIRFTPEHSNDILSLDNTVSISHLTLAITRY